MKILLKLAFLGSAYCGYQVQKDKPTVQGALNEAARKLFSCECDIVGCSRTDSGVHANEFCVTVSQKGECYLDTAIPPEKIPDALNFYLPEDISVKSAEPVANDFHARYGVKYKEYIYRIYCGKLRDPFEVGRSLHYPRTLGDADVARLNLASEQFVGRHDFSAFMASGSKITDTVREVKYAEVTKEGNILTFRVAADGFLYNMVRIMVGTLISVAEGKIAPEDICEIIESRDRQRAGSTVSPSGLYLNRVVYNL